MHISSKSDLPILSIYFLLMVMQYFLWYLPLLPLLLPRLIVTPLRAAVLLLVWVGTQALWLSEAYKLEFLGRDVFFGLWVRSLIYVCGGAWVLGEVMHCYV